jgi:hypothetical protein
MLPPASRAQVHPTMGSTIRGGAKMPAELVGTLGYGNHTSPPKVTFRRGNKTTTLKPWKR